MSLKAIKLRKEISLKQKTLEELRSKKDEFEQRKADLENAIEEAASEEDLDVVNEEIEKLDGEIKENADAVDSVSKEVEKLEEELKECDTEEPVVQPQPEAKDERKVNKKMETRDFRKMSYEERSAFVEKDEVKNFLGEVRTCISEKRALSNAGLLIPEVMLGLIKPVVVEYSKLYSKVYVKVLKGTGRAVIEGTIPEAVWTEMCANLNELALGFNDVEVDGYKVGGFIPVCNAALEDSDIDLAEEIILAIGQAIGIALDKAIVYGTGVKMPLGMVTRLAQTSQPADYPATARPWVDLHVTNVITGTSSLTGLELFQEIMLKTAVTANKYKRNSRVFLMNEATHTYLKSQLLNFNVNGAIVSGIDNVMPIIGGEIIELEFIPDNNVVFGYAELYLLAERKGMQLNSSEHVRFIQDQTVFKGTARYDGKPVIAEAFAVYGINGTVPTTSVDFAEDTANFQ